MNNKNSIFLVLAVSSLVLISFVKAQDERGKITIQGWLTDANRNPLTGVYIFNFSIYDSLEGGSLLWSQVKNVRVNNGIFSTEIGPISLDFNISYYLEILINNEILRPRYNLTAAPYSFISIYGGMGNIQDVWVNETGDKMTGGLIFSLPSGVDYAIQINTTTDYGTIVVNGSALQIWSNKLNSRGNLWVRNISAEWINSTGLCLSNDCRSSWPVGDITGVYAGAGLLGGGCYGDVTLSANTSYLQRRVNGICDAGSSIRIINEDGTVVCEVDDVGELPTGSFGQTLWHDGTNWVATNNLYNDGTKIGIGTTSPGAKLDVNGSIRTNQQLISTVTSGTPPLVVNSNTLVNNLNADLLDGQDGSYYTTMLKQDSGVIRLTSVTEIHQASCSPNYVGPAGGNCGSSGSNEKYLTCPSGWYAISGGGYCAGNSISHSFPLLGPSGWIGWYVICNGAITPFVYAVCVH
ncbi:MAG: hypothetical protein QXP77_01375 [Candidatus Aenigmatarchaeota archaeon]